ncbi:glycoside hydrolase family 28 protein [Algibacter amylolyticus]|uniref:Glycoside hydrolase family 28 protein n=1 Tax=Algibacter amylolyticus TaxID=1608400 RepID=A0A5M7BGT6_9FLAO|nr:glycoside hydrolase family 28 protein [Algibacter amylolyticus]KAA5827990.1 glycoside hydrolase family 28 protein [Algibacter amylolyticus]MBB5267230.1 polygalacturonase [Algibacter amylolyticus]TSJ82235.1 glycoside hydrolase family 28 protein [Algibacter amylolyticus]
MNKLALIFCLSLWVFSCKQSEIKDIKQSNDIDIYKGVEFDMPKVKTTSFPNYEVSITDFGAQSGGLVKNTEAFAKAINDVNAKGGGKVVVPRGIWLTGPITFKSNINLHLEDGSLILFSDNFDDYPLVKTSFEGLHTVRCISPINAFEVENIAITGRGIIDGNGDAWRPVKKGKMTSGQWKKLLKSGGALSEDEKIWFPSKSSKKGHESSTNFNVPDLISDAELESVKDFLRPVMVSISTSKRILLDGPTFQNSPAWNIHPLKSEDIIIRNLSVRNPWYSQNGDGLDLDSCKNVLIYNNTFDVGDDAICFKSGKNEDGRKLGMPTQNVIVKNNTVYHAHGGFIIGSEMSGGVKNVHVSNCTFIGTDVGLRFKSTRGRGGLVENIYISNINMTNIPAEAIRFNMFYGGESPILDEGDKSMEEKRDEVLVEVTEETPSFRNIYMKNIRVSNSEKAAFFMGLPEMSLKNVSLENAVFETKKGIVAIDVDGLKLSNVEVIASNDHALTIYNGKNVTVENLTFNKSKSAIKVLGEKSENIQFNKEDFSNINAQILQGQGVLNTAVEMK